MIAGLEAERTEQMRALVRQLVELAIGDCLATARHLIGDFVWLGAGVDRRMGHRAPRAQFSRKKSAAVPSAGQRPIAGNLMESRGVSGLALTLPAVVIGPGSRLALLAGRDED